MLRSHQSSPQRITEYYSFLGKELNNKKKQPLVSSSPATCNMPEVNLHQKLSPAFKFHEPHLYQAATASGSLVLGERWLGTNRTACYAQRQGKTIREASGHFVFLI